MKWACLICSKEFTRVWSLRRHVRRHDQETKRLTCSTCFRNFGRIYTFHRHVKAKHPDESITPVQFNPRHIAQTPVIQRTWEAVGVKNNVKKGQHLSQNTTKDVVFRLFAGIQKAKENLHRRETEARIYKEPQLIHSSEYNPPAQDKVSTVDGYDTPLEDEFWQPDARLTKDQQIKEIDLSIISTLYIIMDVIKHNNPIL